MARGITTTSTVRLTLAMLGLVLGFATFSQVSHSWVGHSTSRSMPHYGGLLVGAVALCVVLRSCFLRETAIAHRAARRFGRALCPLIAAIPLSVWQWMLWRNGRGGAFDDTPWPLYAWMGILTVCAWRVALLLRSIEIRRATLWRFLTFALGVMIGLHVWMQYRAWDSLSFGYQDIGLFARAIFNAARGEGLLVESFGYSLLGEHGCFLLYGLVPFALVGVDPFHILVFTSAIVINAPALLVAWYVQRRLGSNIAAVIGALSWLMLPSLGCLVIERGYGFHAVSLAVPLLVAGLSLTLLHRFRAATVCMLLAMLAREDMAFTVGAWGVYVAIFHKRRLLGTTVILCATAYFLSMVHMVIPHFRGGSYPWVSAHFSLQDSLTSLSSDFSANAAFVATLVLPMALLLVRPDPILLVALPALVETVLITNPELRNISVHYHTPVVPVLFFAALQSWIRRADYRRFPFILRYPPRLRRRRRVMQGGWCLLVAAWAGQTYLGLGPHTNSPDYCCWSEGLPESRPKIRQIREGLARSCGVTASYRIAAHFLDFDRVWTVADEQLADVVVVDDRDRWDNSKPRTMLSKAYAMGGYHPVYADYHLVALVRAELPTPLSLELCPDQVPAFVSSVSFELGEGIELIGFDLRRGDSAESGSSAYQVTLIWRCSHRISADYRFGLILGEDHARWGPFYFARGAYPTDHWEPGKLYRDDLRIVVPAHMAPELRRIQPVLLEGA